jgi:hypothetical protein
LVEEGLIKRLMTSIKCGVCGHRYGVDNINVLSHDQDLWFLSAICSSCHTRCLIAATVREGKAPEVITDLTEAELRRFRNAGKLTADDVLDMHDFLKNFDGDFSRLFDRGRFSK